LIPGIENRPSDVEIGDELGRANITQGNANPTGFGQIAKLTAARPIVRHINELPISVDGFGTGNGAFAATADTIIGWAVCQLFELLCLIPDRQKLAQVRSLCGGQSGVRWVSCIGKKPAPAPVAIERPFAPVGSTARGNALSELLSERYQVNRF